MTTPRYNLLAVRKEIGAIEYRLADDTLPASIRRDIIGRHITNLICDLTTTPANRVKFGGILERMATRYTSDLEIVAGCALLESLLPKPTYGTVVAGTTIRLGSLIGTKRKGGFQLANGLLIEHPAPDAPVVVINA